MRSLVLAVLLFIPALAFAQPLREPLTIVPVEASIRAGIDQDRIDSIYVDGSGPGCDHCRFDAKQADAYDAAWNDFVGQIVNGLVENDVTFEELGLRAYFGADGRLDYLLYHVGGDAANNERFVKAARKVQQEFRFALNGFGPFKQCATIALGSPFEGQ